MKKGYLHPTFIGLYSAFSFELSQLGTNPGTCTKNIFFHRATNLVDNLARLLLDLSPLADPSCDRDDDLAGGVEHVLHLVDARLHLHVRQVEVGVEDEDDVAALLLVLEVHLGLLQRRLPHHRVEVLCQQAEGRSDQRDQLVGHLEEVCTRKLSCFYRNLFAVVPSNLFGRRVHCSYLVPDERSIFVASHQHIA